MKKYDVIIVGAGPAGIFTALELVEKSAKVLIVEKGRDISKRHCYSAANKTACINCKPCDIVCGWGGAGAFSDGKLTLTTEFGGMLDTYLDNTELTELIDYIDSIYLKFGATPIVYGLENQELIRDLQQKAAAADLKFIPAQIRHLGTEKCGEILGRMYSYLKEKCEILTLTQVEKILTNQNDKKIPLEEIEYKGIQLADGTVIESDYLVVAPGREGSEWFAKETSKLGLASETNPVDIGVRVEVPAVITEKITEAVYESKLIYYTKSFDDRVRTFCMNPYGVVSTENNAGLITVNGHSYLEQRTQNTNFALLVSKSFTEPFKEPITYGKSIAKLANLLGGGVIVQRLGDLKDGRRSTVERIKRGLVDPTLKDATPGDLSLVLPYRHLLAIEEMLDALDVIIPGVNSRHTLLYGVEAKFYSSRPRLTNKLETQIKNIFAIGDGAGVTRGLAQASCTGVIVGREILNRNV
ncbi:NAD(P)/FAD-dependent oxidoreductase [Selenomonadales bacterium OttesenSCG-928-I06]|nr:NAD(P)/FAD-dependent oxidoreductase [Selenomonadales bacterium OttesenSCG-928-I06]